MISRILHPVVKTVAASAVAGPSPERIRSEIAVFKKKGVADNVYKFFLDGPEPYMVLAAKTNSQKVYTLRVELKNFPNEVPKVFVTRMLKNLNGCKMDGISGSMHTLESEHGWTRICHYGNGSWSQNVSLYKIYVKCCLWLNMYELHLSTGNDIDYYLNHQA